MASAHHAHGSATRRENVEAARPPGGGKRTQTSTHTRCVTQLEKGQNPAIGHMDEPGDTVLVEQASHRRTDTEREAVTAARQCERTRYPWTRKRFGRQVSSCVLYHDKNNKKASAPRPCRTECRSPTGVLLGPKPMRRGWEAAAAPSPRARCVPSTPAVLFQRSSPLAL